MCSWQLQAESACGRLSFSRGSPCLLTPCRAHVLQAQLGEAHAARSELDAVHAQLNDARAQGAAMRGELDAAAMRLSASTQAQVHCTALGASWHVVHSENGVEPSVHGGPP